jgi:GNAT superfamily N-acetyltransferase
LAQARSNGLQPGTAILLLRGRTGIGCEGAAGIGRVAEGCRTYDRARKATTLLPRETHVTGTTTTSSAIDIVVADTAELISETFGVMQQLRPNLLRHQYVPMIRYLMAREGFAIAALRDEGQVRAVTGFRIITMLYRGRILYVDDLVTDARDRSKGYGALMLEWLKAEAGRKQCCEIQLISRNHRLDAHRFYERQGFRTDCRHFSLPLA